MNAGHDRVVLEVPLSPQQCAELAGVHYQTILARIGEGHLKAFKPAGGREYRVRPRDFEAWLYGTPVEPKQPEPEQPTTSRGAPTRGSVAALDEIERGRAA